MKQIHRYVGSYYVTKVASELSGKRIDHSTKSGNWNFRKEKLEILFSTQIAVS